VLVQDAGVVSDRDGRPSSAGDSGAPALSPENGVEIRRRIAIMPESPGLYLRLSVAIGVLRDPLLVCTVLVPSALLIVGAARLVAHRSRSA
jgi:hypothetical protein